MTTQTAGEFGYTETTDLPVLSVLPHGYRDPRFEEPYNIRGLWNGTAESAMPPADTQEGLNRLAHGYPRTAAAVSIWNEAHNEQARRSADRQQEFGPLDDLRHKLELANAEVDRLRNEQIKGDDPRLAEFWAKANEVASNAGHCSVYDQMAQELGGPGRVKSYDFDVSVSTSVSVSAQGLTPDEAWQNVSREEVFEAFQNSNIDSYSLNYSGWDDWSEADD